MEHVQNATAIISKEQLLHHWQGHRGLTRRVIEAFPEKELFEYRIGGMRPFFIMAMEVTDLASAGIKGLATNEWDAYLPHDTGEGLPKTKEELLAVWDATTSRLDTYWQQLTEERFAEEIVAFGSYPGTVLSTIMYFIDNEIHHRGQGYVYLRGLGIEPPAFYERPRI